MKKIPICEELTYDYTHNFPEIELKYALKEK